MVGLPEECIPQMKDSLCQVPVRPVEPVSLSVRQKILPLRMESLCIIIGVNSVVPV